MARIIFLKTYPRLFLPEFQKRNSWIITTYTDENEEMLYVIVNKYEVNHLKRIIHSYDPKAFIVANSGVNVDGHFLKHLS